MIARSAESGKTWASRLDPDKALARFAMLLDGEDVPGVRAVVLNDSHIFLYTVASPWWGGDNWLAELFYIRVARGSTPLAMEAIELLARDSFCSSIVFATSLAARDASLGRLLHQYGYKQESTQHIKDV